MAHMLGLAKGAKRLRKTRLLVGKMLNVAAQQKDDEIFKEAIIKRISNPKNDGLSEF